jgi:hypothetical protein
MLLLPPEPGQTLRSGPFPDLSLLLDQLVFKPAHPPDLSSMSAQSLPVGKSTRHSPAVTEISTSKAFLLGLVLDALEHLDRALYSFDRVLK